MGNLDTFTVYAFKDETLAGGADSTSGPIKLNDYKPRHDKATAQVFSAGANSVVKLECLVSNDGVAYGVPVGQSDIVTGHTPGTSHYTFDLPVAKYLKIKATETSGPNAVSDLDVLIGLR